MTSIQANLDSLGVQAERGKLHEPHELGVARALVHIKALKPTAERQPAQQCPVKANIITGMLIVRRLLLHKSKPNTAAKESVKLDLIIQQSECFEVSLGNSICSAIWPMSTHHRVGVFNGWVCTGGATSNRSGEGGSDHRQLYVFGQVIAATKLEHRILIIRDTVRRWWRWRRNMKHTRWPCVIESHL